MRRWSCGGWGGLCAGLALVQTAAAAAPAIIRVSTPGGAPATAAAPGDELLIQGSGFGSASGEVWLDRGGYGREAAVLAWNAPDGTIHIRIPASADLGSIGLIVRAGDQGSAPYPLQLAAVGSAPALPAPASSPTPPPPLPPAITGYALGEVAVTQVHPADFLAIRGTNLGTGGQVSILGHVATVRSWTPREIDVVVPFVAGTGPVRIVLNPHTGAETRAQGPNLTVTTGN